jgi:hypothetical protein
LSGQDKLVGGGDARGVTRHLDVQPTAARSFGDRAFDAPEVAESDVAHDNAHAG